MTKSIIVCGVVAVLLASMVACSARVEPEEGEEQIGQSQAAMKSYCTFDYTCVTFGYSGICAHEGDHSCTRARTTCCGTSSHCSFQLTGSNCLQ